MSYNYSNSITYKVVARAGNTTFLHQQSLAIGQTLAVNSSNLTQSFLYDANGNLITDGQYFYEYNPFNQLSKIREGNSTGIILSDYLYDSNGNRIRKHDRIKNETVFYINPNFLRVINSSGTFDTIYYFDGSTMVARKDPDSKKFFYHPDHLGSTTLVTNESGSIVENTNYKPFGEVLYDGKSKYLYTGKEKDSESGLYYYGARYYNPAIGRFIQPDSMIPKPYNPQYLNRYSYVLNNPYKYIDPNGNEVTRSQLGSYEIFYNDIVKFENFQSGNNPGQTASQTLSCISNFGGLFHSDIRYNENNAFLYNSNARYLQTSKGDYIDNLHFMQSAAKTKEVGSGMADAMGQLMEFFQYVGGHPSGYSKEDLPSNALGREFAIGLDDKSSLSQQYKKFMEEKGALKDPIFTYYFYKGQNKAEGNKNTPS